MFKQWGNILRPTQSVISFDALAAVTAVWNESLLCIGLRNLHTYPSLIKNMLRGTGIHSKSKTTP